VIRQRGAESSRAFALRRQDPRSRKKLWLRLGLGVLVSGLLVVGGWWLLTSPVFAIRTVESGSYRFTSEEQLEGVLASFLGRNIWSVSAGAVSDSLADLPWIRDLKVRRRLPDALAVDFREWRPVLLIEPDTPGQFPRVLVEDGRVLAFPDHLVPPGLPVLVGVECTAGPRPGEWLLAPEPRDNLLQLMAAIESTGLEIVCPIDFIVARPEGFGIVLQDGRGSLLVGREEFTARLDRYMVARDHLEPGLQMDLRFADKITCRRI
jgi:hypothetical protein